MRSRPLPWGAVILLVVAQTAIADHSLDYLYIEANSGTSSGGHVAVKLDETVYHFQNKDGLILVQRDDWPRFRHLYADLDNRDIHAARVLVPEAVQSEIKQHLDLFHLNQKALLERAASLGRDLELLEALTQKRPFLLQGAGLFQEKKASLAPRPHVFLALSSRDRQNFLLHRLQTLTQKRESLQYFDSNYTAEESSPANFGQGYADQWMDLLQNEIALEFVLGRKEINPALLMDGGPLVLQEEPKDCSAQNWLTRYLSHLEEDATRLLLHPYPGSGLPLLRTLARAEAVKLSLQRGRLYLILPGLTSETSEPQNDTYLQSAQNHLETDFRQHLEELRHRVFCSNEIDDLPYHKLELAGLDLREAIHANQQEMPVRFDHEPDLPNAPGLITPVQIENSIRPRATELDNATEARDRLADEISERMRYNLITRNCVTELIKAMYFGFENNQEPPEFKGHIDPSGSQAFVPFRFFELVLKRYPVGSTTKILSFRHQKLAQLTAEDRGPWLGIREGNTLTSKLYRPRETDGVFLFFTDDTLWTRPLLGGANLGTAMGAMALGLVGFPLDEGRLLKAGARGALFSLPEIALWNVRKGSYTEVTLRN
ncbi:MAG: hypothetical protein RLZ25_1834 [Pseudomonadota bacterium]